MTPKDIWYDRPLRQQKCLTVWGSLYLLQSDAPILRYYPRILLFLFGDLASDNSKTYLQTANSLTCTIIDRVVPWVSNDEGYSRTIQREG
jgi:hypothetical protein